MSDRQNAITKIVRALMRVHGDRQKDVAAHLSLSAGQVSQRMNGSARWQIDELDSLAARWNVEVTAFLKDPDDLERELRETVQNWKFRGSVGVGPITVHRHASLAGVG